MRQIFLSLISLLAVIAFIVWWSTRSIDTLPQANDTESATPQTIPDILNEAEKAKELLEGKTLSSLDLSNQGLTKVPSYVFSETHLQSLDLSHNTLDGSLQAEIRQLQNLRSLDLSSNNFTGVPAEIGQLKDLEVLDLSNNSLTGLPHELGNLSNLKILRLSGNNYSETDLTVIRKTLPASTVVETK